MVHYTLHLKETGTTCHRHKRPAYTVDLFAICLLANATAGGARMQTLRAYTPQGFDMHTRVSTGGFAHTGHSDSQSTACCGLNRAGGKKGILGVRFETSCAARSNTIMVDA